MIGQKTHSFLFLSIIMQVLQSGKPGLSAITNGSLQVDSPCGNRAAEHGHVVGRALARPAIPRDQQIAVRAFDDARRVVVPRIERKDQLFAILARRATIAGKQKHPATIKQTKTRRIVNSLVGGANIRVWFAVGFNGIIHPAEYTA